MKKLLSAFLFLTVLLGACSNGAVPAEIESTQNLVQTETATNAPAATEFIATEPVVLARVAVLSEFENTVIARESSSQEYSAAIINMNLLATGSVETGEDGRARINLLPEGTIVRVAPNSLFTIPELTVENGEPKTVIELFFGKVFILLNGGSLEVQTPSGVASVRGSLLSVEFNPEKNRVEAVCLEGHCALKDEDGEEVELIEGESSFIEGEEPPSEPEPIDREDIEDWLEESPELEEFIEELPNPEDFPEDFDESSNSECPPDAVCEEALTEEPIEQPTEEPIEEPVEEPTEEPTPEGWLLFPMAVIDHKS